MTDDLHRTSMEAEGGNAFERAKDMLDAAGVSPDLVERIEVNVMHLHPDSEMADRDGDSAEPGGDDNGGAEIETGPVEPGPSRRGGGGHGSGGYDGTLPSRPFRDSESVRPDTQSASTMQALWDDDDEWVRGSEVSVDGLDSSQVHDALSDAFRNGGYLDRRRMNPQPNEKGVQREYRINQSGKNALREGRRIAEQYREEERERQEREMDGA